MADEPTLYRYTSNKAEWDSAEAIVVGENDDGTPKVMYRGGAPVVLSDAELANARKRYNITALTDKQAEVYVVDESTSVGVPRSDVEGDEGGDGVADAPNLTGDEPAKRSRRASRSRSDDSDARAAGDDAGAVDVNQGGDPSGSADAAAGTSTPAGDNVGQGTSGASGQDVGTTAGAAG